MSSSISISGFNNFDSQTIVSLLVKQARAPINLLQSQQQQLRDKANAAATLKSSISSLKSIIDELDGDTLFTSATAKLSSPDVITATAANSATTGTYSVTVNTLAKAQTQASQGYSAADAEVPTGSLSIRIGSMSADPIQINVTTGTLTGLKDAINNKNAGVSATIVNTGSGANPYKLLLTTTNTGTANAIVEIDTSGLNQGSGTVPTFTVTQEAVNSSVTVNGVTVTASSNTITDVIPGVTLNLLKEGASTTLTLSNNDDVIRGALRRFVDSYNEANRFVQSQFKSDTNSRTGVLAGQAVLRVARTQLTEIANTEIATDSDITRLTNIGIQRQDDGSLKIDDAALTDALTNNRDAVKLFLQGGQTPAGDTITGFARTISDTLDSLLDSESGIIGSASSSYQTSITNLQKQIDRMEDRIKALQRTLSLRFLATDRAIAQLQGQASFLTSITQQLSRLNGNNNNK